LNGDDIQLDSMQEIEHVRAMNHEAFDPAAYKRESVESKVEQTRSSAVSFYFSKKEPPVDEDSESLDGLDPFEC
jgi:hypothetical protein